MKKAVLSTILLSGLLLGSSVVNAADPNEKDRNRNAETDVNIKLTDEGTSKPEPGPFYGALAFVESPRPYSFSGDVVSGAGQVNLVASKVNSGNKNLVVNDDRRDKDSDNGFNTPWTVSAQFKDVKLVGGENKPLEGAVLTLKPSKAYLYNIGDKIEETDHGLDIIPEPVPKIDDNTPDAKDVTTSEVKLAAEGAAQPIMKSTKAGSTGEISTLNRGAFTNLSDAKLSVSSANKQGTYKGKLLWTLTSDYSNSND